MERGHPSKLHRPAPASASRYPSSPEIHVHDERAYDALQDDEHIPADRDRRMGERVHGERREEHECERGPVRMHPSAQRAFALTPAPCEPATRDLEGEGDEDGQREVLLREPLLNHLQRGHGGVGLEADLGDEQENEECLDIYGVG